jgi:hypothetical protein
MSSLYRDATQPHTGDPVRKGEKRGDRGMFTRNQTRPLVLRVARSACEHDDALIAPQTSWNILGTAQWSPLRIGLVW